MSQKKLSKKMLVVVFEHKDKNKTGIGKDIPASIELDITKYNDVKTETVVKELFKSFNLVILTAEETQKDKIQLMNVLRKHCKLKNIFLREIRIGYKEI